MQGVFYRKIGDELTAEGEPDFPWTMIEIGDAFDSDYPVY